MGIDYQIMEFSCKNQSLLWIICGKNLTKVGNSVTLLFNETVPQGTVGIVAVCWRLIAEYIPFLIGFYYTIKVFGVSFLQKKKESEQSL